MSTSQQPFGGPGLGFDPAKPSIAPPKIITNTRVELPSSAYRLDNPNVSVHNAFHTNLDKSDYL